MWLCIASFIGIVVLVCLLFTLDNRMESGVSGEAISRKRATKDQATQTESINWEQIGRDVECFIRLCQTMCLVKEFEELFAIGREAFPDLDPGIVRAVAAAHYPIEEDQGKEE